MVIPSSLGMDFASLSPNALGMSMTRQASRMEFFAFMVPKVTIWVTQSSPYFSVTYSMTRFLPSGSKSTSISGMDTLSGFKNLSKKS